MKAIEVLQEICDGIEGAKVYEDYSGRGMFGKTCLGISCDNATSVIEDASRLFNIRNSKTDQLGLGYIVYWEHLDKDSEVKDDSDCSFYEVVEKWRDSHRVHCLEGSSGTKGLSKLVKVLGYDSIESFLQDNSGCTEAMIDWIANTDLEEWKQEIKDDIDSK